MSGKLSEEEVPTMSTEIFLFCSCGGVSKPAVLSPGKDLKQIQEFHTKRVRTILNSTMIPSTVKY